MERFSAYIAFSHNDLSVNGLSEQVALIHSSLSANAHRGGVRASVSSSCDIPTKIFLEVLAPEATPDFYKEACDFSPLWPDAASKMDNPGCILKVSIQGVLSPVELSTLLTMAVRKVLLTAEGTIGVVWRTAMQAVAPNVFLFFADKIVDELPVALWVSFHECAAAEEGVQMGYTQGLAALGWCEIEFLEKGNEQHAVRDTLYGASYQMISQQQPLNAQTEITGFNGETYGVQLTGSFNDRLGQVYKLYPCQSDESKKGWWKFWGNQEEQPITTA